MNGKVIIEGKKINFSDVLNVAKNNYPITLSDNAIRLINKATSIIEKWVKSGKVVYGMTTGVGDNIRILIPPRLAKELSENIIISHAAGVGKPLPTEVVRGMMLIRINTLAEGKSGVALPTIRLLTEMLNRHIHPVVPEQGSVGASGDLAPLSHIAITLIGEGLVEYKGKIDKTINVFRKLGLKPVSLTYKEGLALINGTTGMTAIAALLIPECELLLKIAQAITAISLEVLYASIEPFNKKGHLLKPHPGQLAIASNLSLLLLGSRLIKNVKQITSILEKELSDDIKSSDIHRQEAYSLRCIPQILGPVWDILQFVKNTVYIELNAVDDNPLILSENEVFHGGNFHGQPIAMAMDYLAIALTEIGVLSERRTARLLDRTLNHDLPPFLASGEPGLNYGYQGAQYVATSLVAENRYLATPVSTQSISTNAQFQDVVSMGMIAARRTKQIFENTIQILTLELMCAVQAAEFRQAEKLSPASKTLYDVVREVLPKLQGDRVISYDFEKVRNKVYTDECLRKIETTIKHRLK